MWSVSHILPIERDTSIDYLTEVVTVERTTKGDVEQARDLELLHCCSKKTPDIFLHYANGSQLAGMIQDILER